MTFKIAEIITCMAAPLHFEHKKLKATMTELQRCVEEDIYFFPFEWLGKGLVRNNSNFESCSIPGPTANETSTENQKVRKPREQLISSS